jgi:hypothetical protein
VEPGELADRQTDGHEDDLPRQQVAEQAVVGLFDEPVAAADQEGEHAHHDRRDHQHEQQEAERVQPDVEDSLCPAVRARAVDPVVLGQPVPIEQTVGVRHHRQRNDHADGPPDPFEGTEPVLVQVHCRLRHLRCHRSVCPLMTADNNPITIS